MHAPLCFGGRHALYAVYPAFVFEGAVHILAGYIGYHFTEATGRAIDKIGNGELPTHFFAEFLIHAQQVSGKKSRFITTGTGPDFQNGILAVGRIFGDEQLFELFFQLFFLGFQLIELHFGHFTKLRVFFGFKHLFGRLDIGKHIFIFFIYGYHLAQFFVFFTKPGIVVHIGHYIGLAHQLLHLLVSAGYFFQFVYHIGAA